MRLGPELIYGPNSTTSDFLPKKKNKMILNAFYNFLQITPDIFAETVIGKSKLKRPIQTKWKTVSKIKNSAGLV